MTMTIPALTPMPAGYIAQAADMNAMAYAATFLLTKPVTRVHDGTGGYTITANVETAVKFTIADFDSDGMWNATTPNLLTIQTPGFYKVRAGVNLTAASCQHNCYLVSTTGYNSPAGPGIVSSQHWQGASVGDLANPCSRTSGVWPVYLYAGDYIQLFAASAGTTTQDNVNGGSYLSMELVSI
jgi:hypothetical protein